MTWTQMFAVLVSRGEPTGFVNRLAHDEWDDTNNPYNQMVLTPEARVEMREWLRNFYPPASTTDD